LGQFQGFPRFEFLANAFTLSVALHLAVGKSAGKKIFAGIQRASLAVDGTAREKF